MTDSFGKFLDFQFAVLYCNDRDSKPADTN